MAKKAKINISGVTDSEEEEFPVDIKMIDKLIKEARAKNKEEEVKKLLEQVMDREPSFETLEEESLIDSFEIFDED